MNHRKAIPAKGTSVNANETSVVFPWSHAAAFGPLKSSGKTSHEQHHGDGKQHGKKNSRDGGGARRPESLTS